MRRMLLVCVVLLLGTALASPSISFSDLFEHFDAAHEPQAIQVTAQAERPALLVSWTAFPADPFPERAAAVFCAREESFLRPPLAAARSLPACRSASRSQTCSQRSILLQLAGGGCRQQQHQLSPHSWGALAAPLSQQQLRQQGCGASSRHLCAGGSPQHPLGLSEA
jgi:hypothetical protein